MEVAAGEVEIQGGVYDLESGEVEFFGSMPNPGHPAEVWRCSASILGLSDMSNNGVGNGFTKAVFDKFFVACVARNSLMQALFLRAHLNFKQTARLTIWQGLYQY